MSKRDGLEHDAEVEQVTGEPKEEPPCADCGNPVPDSPAPVEELIAQLSAAEKKSQESYDRLLRVSAEFENYKKRTAREMKELIKFANEKIAKELLTVVDNLERAIESASGRCTPDDPLVQGVEMTLGEIIKLLERHQISPIQAMGQPFDPNYHQAMMQEEAAGHPPNTVVKVLQKGYMIHDRLLRPSLVAVSKGSANKEENASSENGSSDLSI